MRQAETRVPQSLRPPLRQTCPTAARPASLRAKAPPIPKTRRQNPPQEKARPSPLKQPPPQTLRARSGPHRAHRALRHEHASDRSFPSLRNSLRPRNSWKPRSSPPKHVRGFHSSKSPGKQRHDSLQKQTGILLRTHVPRRRRKRFGTAPIPEKTTPQKSTALRAEKPRRFDL